MRHAISALTVATLLLAAAPAHAKLPPASDEAKAKAAGAAAKSAWSDKVAGFKLCGAMNRAADHYRKSAKAAGKDVPPAVETPACADPGPFVEPVPVSGPATVPAVAATAPAAAPKK
jgi:hypothetical protein